MTNHSDNSRVAEALSDDATLACILRIRREQGALRVIGVDEEVIREAVELHPGADRELLRGFFTFRPEADAP